MDNDAQILFNVNNGVVTLTSQHGTTLHSRIDEAPLDSLFYTEPLTTGFDLTTLALPTTTTAASAITVYVQMIGAQLNKPQYARLSLRRHPNGEFVDARGGLLFTASYQSRTNKGGTAYLPYY